MKGDREELEKSTKPCKCPDTLLTWYFCKAVSILRIEDELTEDVIPSRGRSCCAVAIARIKTELKASCLDDNVTGLVILLLNELLEIFMKNVNGVTILNDPSRQAYDFP